VAKLNEISLARVPFAVKGGGHHTNPGFSSTPGVHISMARFNDIVIHEDSETVEIGAGLTWTDVYKYLVPKGINVVGGRIDGVGVAGYTLGGGKWTPFLHPIHGVNSKLYPSGRIFLENKSIWAHRRHYYAIRARITERRGQDSDRER
jgi:hypothetical protein